MLVSEVILNSQSEFLLRFAIDKKTREASAIFNYISRLLKTFRFTYVVHM